MPSQETNPFRRASMLQGTSFATYESNEAHQQRGDTTPPESPAPRRLTEVWTPEKTPDSSPAPRYSPKAPKSHTVVRADLVARMSALEDDTEHIVRLATEDAPPKYPAAAHAKDSLPNYEEAVSPADRIRSAGFPGVGYNSAFASFGRYEDIRHIQEATEARRRDIEESNRTRKQLRRAGGIWRCFRCCIPKAKRGGGAVGMTKTSKNTIWAVLLVIILVVAIPLVVIKVISQEKNQYNQVPVNGDGKRQSAQLLEVPGFPPIPTGVTVVQPAMAANKQTTCVSPRELWSCDLPPPATNKIPEFRFEIRYRPADRQRDGPDSIWAPRPAPVPSAKDYKETAAQESRNSTTSAGIATEFTISMNLINNTPIPEQNDTLVTRSESISEEYDEKETLNRELQDYQIFKRQSISDPSQNPPSMLPTVLRNQPLRLMNKGLPSEHYTAHMYFQKSIYLDSINISSRQPLHNNEVTGSSDAARFACIWSFTRFKIQIFTRKSQELIIVDRDQNRYQIDPDFGNSMTDTKDPILPYPVTIFEDRVVGSENKPGHNIACYEILKNEGPEGGKRLGKRYGWGERKSDKTLTSTLDGVKKEGCFCEWGNWKQRTRFDQGR